MSIYRLDYETTSACDIKLGAWKYASHPSTRILMFAIARDSERPLIWRFDQPDAVESQNAKELFEEALDLGSPIYAFNAGFEMAISHYRLMADVGLPAPAIEQWRCSQAMCRRAGIPASLANAAEFLKLEQQKDKTGKALIAVFSDQTKLTTLRRTHLDGDIKVGNEEANTLEINPTEETDEEGYKVRESGFIRVTVKSDGGAMSRKSQNPILETPIPWDWTLTVAGATMTVRDAWGKFIEYCRQDVVTERKLHEVMAKFELTGDELDGFHFTARMNALGAPVNIRALNHAQKIIDAVQKDLTTEFEKLTSLQPSQTAKVLQWLQNRGYPEDNLQAGTIEDVVSGPKIKRMSAEGQRALTIRSELSFAAVKKVRSLLDTSCPDGRLRGSFIWYGAGKTGRWTSTGAQLQNAKKPTIENPDQAYADICCEVDVDDFRIYHANPYEAVASVVRNFIQPHSGKVLAVDFSNIESRVAALIAGQNDLLDMYRDGRDAYKELASSVFGVPVDEVTKEQRFVGKVGCLSLVYQTGAKTFHETCAAWGMPIEKKLACLTVKTFRETNSMFPKTWRAFESSAIKAIKEPGTWFKVNEFVSFGMTNSKPFPRLLMKLVSGRCLTLPYPEVKRSVKIHRDYETGEVREWESDEISFYGSQRNSSIWGRVITYSGSAFQSAVQSTARDIMQQGCVTAQRRGYKIFSIIHDEVLAHDDHPDGLEGLEDALCALPKWLPQGTPISVAGTICDYYTKD